MYLISVLRGNTKNYKNRKTHQKCCDWIFSAFFLFLSIFITWIMHMSNLSDKFLFKKFPFFHNAKKKFLAWKNFENREVSNKSVCQGKLPKKKVRDITAIGYSRVDLTWAFNEDRWKSLMAIATHLSIKFLSHFSAFFNHVFLSSKEKRFKASFCQIIFS